MEKVNFIQGDPGKREGKTNLAKLVIVYNMLLELGYMTDQEGLNGVEAVTLMNNVEHAIVKSINKINIERSNK